MPVPATPDPEMGVFETLLVLDGRPIELDAHLGRLAASLQALFGAALSDEARARLIEKAIPLGSGRLRLTATPHERGRVSLDVRAEEVDPALVFPSATHAVALRGVVVPGGLGAHKWADRRLLERSEAETSAVPLLLDADGSVLEAARANVFAARAGVLSTPPVDGRILPGVTRAIATDIARAADVELREAHLTPQALIEADEVFLTGAVRGVEPVRSIDGIEMHPAGRLTRLLAGELRHRWMGQG